jgi:hypothetical protein
MRKSASNSIVPTVSRVSRALLAELRFLMTFSMVTCWATNNLLRFLKRPVVNAINGWYV